MYLHEAQITAASPNLTSGKLALRMSTLHEEQPGGENYGGSSEPDLEEEDEDEEDEEEVDTEEVR